MARPNAGRSRRVETDLYPPCNFTRLHRWVPKYSGHSSSRPRWHVFGHCRHSGGPGSMSAMSWIADGGGIQQSDGSFLRSRTHTPDPLLSFGSSSRRWPLPNSKRSSIRTTSRHVCVPVNKLNGFATYPGVQLFDPGRFSSTKARILRIRSRSSNSFRCGSHPRLSAYSPLRQKMTMLFNELFWRRQRLTSNFSRAVVDAHQ
ncbi:hypothetical protein SAMN05192563_105610 [Paraburkholderia aspalathi]|uniref:Uncharacterized protein n=1 Tax=Paraburkholderia aspalathi TaxID=1324617 RepID=A0A1I7ERC1_9BURK|nr:hypothetical protein SAMN05192563_105610 [Paraburkholderia aspalathi]